MPAASSCRGKRPSEYASHEMSGVNSLAMSGGTVISSGINADGVQVVWYSNDATYDLDVTGGSITGGSGFGAGIRLQSPAGGTVDIGSAASLTAGASGIALVVGADPWDGVIYNGGDLVFTTAGTVTGDVLLGLGSDTVNITGGTLAGNIVGDTGDTVAFALGTGTFTYGSPYTISGVDTVSVSSGTARINGTINANAVNVASGARARRQRHDQRARHRRQRRPHRAGQQSRHAHDGLARSQLPARFSTSSWARPMSPAAR